MEWGGALEVTTDGGTGSGYLPGKEFVQNMNEKMKDNEFLTDVEPLLRPEVHFDPNEAYQLVYDNFIDKLPGKRD